jgi:signal transduction histidine kinase
MHLRRNTLPPPVHIEQVVADRKIYSSNRDLNLPALTKDLRIDYTALSFVVPEKVRFRYRLDGHDRAWEEAGTRRQAFYSDLGPGDYQFHVIAANNDGIWNAAGASLRVSVAAAWYQTQSFKVLCVLLGGFLVWCIYHVRVRQLAATMGARFDERMAERTRLAQELHDTLLQTIQGTKMVADDALDESTDFERMRATMRRVSQWLGQATQEGRAALSSLRVSVTSRNDLAEAFRRAADDCLIHRAMEVNLSVIGEPREMHPIARDEVYRIGYEAIRNACSHSGGTRLTIQLTFAQDLSLRVSDNGTGMDIRIAEHGKDGHFGLRGMHERAARIGGKISISSSAESGTDISLVVPGKIIFRGMHERPKSLLAKIKDAVLRRAPSDPS